MLNFAEMFEKYEDWKVDREDVSPAAFTNWLAEEAEISHMRLMLDIIRTDHVSVYEVAQERASEV